APCRESGCELDEKRHRASHRRCRRGRGRRLRPGHPSRHDARQREPEGARPRLRRRYRPRRAEAAAGSGRTLQLVRLWRLEQLCRAAQPRGSRRASRQRLAPGLRERMRRTPRIVVTGTGAICAAGRTPGEILDAVHAGRSAIAPIRQWDASSWPTRAAGEIADFNASALIPDRKLHKLIRRTDLLGLYAASRAIEDSGLVAHRDTLDEGRAAACNDRAGVYAGAGGGSYQTQYDFFPLLSVAQGDLGAFGRELDGTVNPMWLLRSLPNNVLCHIGIRYGLKGANACVTNHALSGILAVIEAVEALRGNEADRAVAVGHDAPIEPQMVLYYA